MKRSKLDEKAIKGIFIGYAPNSKGYKIFDLKTKKVILSHNVIVDKGYFWDLEKYEVVSDLPTKVEDLCLVVSSSDLFDSSTRDHLLDDDALVEAIGDGSNYKVKSLAEVYEKCSLVIVESKTFVEA